MMASVVAAVVAAGDCSVLRECWQAYWSWLAFRDRWTQYVAAVVGSASARAMVADKWNSLLVRES